jgi:DNA-directed RNA polymerase specialized sigma24 family protein
MEGKSSGPGDPYRAAAEYFYDSVGGIRPQVRANGLRVLRKALAQDAAFDPVTWLDDVVQEACLAVGEALEQGTVRGELPPFAATVLRNKALDVLRGRRAEASLDAPARNNEDSPLPLGERLQAGPGKWDPCDALIVLDLVRRMPPGAYRRAAGHLVLADFDAASALDAIVAEDRCTRDAAKERLSQARALLRQLLVA